MHGPPSGPVYPSAHVQFVWKLDFVCDLVFAGQSLRRPVQHHELTGHSWQAVLLVPWYPRPQKHWIASVAPGGDTALAVHVCLMGPPGQ